ncbi:hypothetical protein [Pseudarthrobacter sp. MDT3-1]
MSITPGINTMKDLSDSDGIEVDCLGGQEPEPELRGTVRRGRAGVDEL